MKIKMQQHESKNLEEAFQEFINYCNVRNLAKDTIIFYENCFKSFSKFFPIQTCVRDISINHIYEYILKQKELNISAISVNSNLRGVRAFLYYCMKLGYLYKN